MKNGKPRLLVVDDERIIRQGMSILLSSMGYEIDVAAEGNEAVQIYRESLESRDLIDAAILDLSIPFGMSGVETLSQLRKIAPEIKAIITSGYINDPILINYQDFGFQAALPKPFTTADLNRVLAQILPPPFPSLLEQPAEAASEPDRKSLPNSST